MSHLWHKGNHTIYMYLLYIISWIIITTFTLIFTRHKYMLYLLYPSVYSTCYNKSDLMLKCYKKVNVYYEAIIYFRHFVDLISISKKLFKCLHVWWFCHQLYMYQQNKWNKPFWGEKPCWMILVSHWIYNDFRQKQGHSMNYPDCLLILITVQKFYRDCWIVL